MEGRARSERPPRGSALPLCRVEGSAWQAPPRLVHSENELLVGVLAPQPLEDVLVGRDHPGCARFAIYPTHTMQAPQLVFRVEMVVISAQSSRQERTRLWWECVLSPKRRALAVSDDDESVSLLDGNRSLLLNHPGKHLRSAGERGALRPAGGHHAMEAAWSGGVGGGAG